VLSEHELVEFLHDVFLVFWIMFVERIDELGFDEALLVEPLLVLEDLQRHEVLLFVVEDPEHDAERTLAEFLDHFVPVAQVLVVPMNVFLLVTIEPMVCGLIDLPVGCSTRQLGVSLVLDAFLHVEVVNSFKLKDLLFLIFEQIRLQNPTCFLC
jgi:hypothetical protein